MAKLAFKILRRRPYETAGAIVGQNFSRIGDAGSFETLEAVDVEWTHADGPFPQWKVMTEKRVNPDTRELEPVEVKIDLPPVAHIYDQATVKAGTPDSIIAMMMEEKRERLAKSLGVEP